MCITLVFYGLSLNTSNLNGNIYLNCFMSAAIDSFGYVAIWVLVDRLPRPCLLSGTMMFSGATLLTLKLIPEGQISLLQTWRCWGEATNVSFVFLRQSDRVASPRLGGKDRYWWRICNHLSDCHWADAHCGQEHGLGCQCYHWIPGLNYMSIHCLYGQVYS